MVQVDEYLFANVCWIVATVILVCKSVYWIKHHDQQRYLLFRVGGVLGAICLFVLLVTWTSLKKGTRPWSAFSMLLERTEMLSAKVFVEPPMLDCVLDSVPIPLRKDAPIIVWDLAFPYGFGTFSLNIEAKKEGHWPANQFAQYYKCDVINSGPTLIAGMSIPFTVTFAETRKTKSVYVGNWQKPTKPRTDTIQVPTLDPHGGRSTFYLFNGTSNFARILAPESAIIQSDNSKIGIKYPSGKPTDMSLGPSEPPPQPPSSPKLSLAPESSPTFTDVLGDFIVIAGGREYKPGAIAFFGESPPAVSAYVTNGSLFVDAQLYSGPNKPPLRLVHNKLEQRPAQWDRNYDGSAIEVIDQGGLPRFQLIYHDKHTIYLRGIFQFGDRALVVEERNQRFFIGSSADSMETGALFKYPSRLYQGQELPDGGKQPPGK